MSLRSSERGLKFCAICSGVASAASLRSSERGLKFIFYSPLYVLPCVAPFVGAWIEIKIQVDY